MRRFGKLALLLMVVAVLSLCLILPVLADENAPIGITDTPTPTDQPVVPPVVPEASTLLLLGSSATGLAAYVGLQIRARRNRP
jgi:hypothetical protein